MQCYCNSKLNEKSNYTVASFFCLYIVCTGQLHFNRPADYAPGSTVYITGTGFAPNESVTMRVIHVGDDLDNATSPDHQPWTITADAGGDITATWFVPTDQDEVGATLLATADQAATDLHLAFHAEATFTDGNVRFTTAGLPAGSVLCNLFIFSIGIRFNYVDFHW